MRHFSKLGGSESKKFDTQDDFFDNTSEEIHRHYIDSADDFNPVDEAESKINDKKEEKVSENLTMLIEERFAKSNLYEYDQKFSDKIRVFAKAGTGGNG